MGTKDRANIKQYNNWITKTWVVCVLACLCCLLWGSAFPLIKIGYRYFQIGAGDFSTQILFAGCRFTFSGILTILIGSIIERKVLVPKRDSYSKIVVISTFQTILQYVFFYIGLANTTGVKASIINGTSVFFALIVSSVFLRQESLSLRAAFGCIIGFAGVVVANLSGNSFDFHMKLTGEGFIILCSLSYGISSSLMKKFSTKENPVVLSGYQFLVGGLSMIIIGVLFGGELTVFTGRGIALLTYLAALSAVAYSIWGILLKYNPVSKVAIFGFSTPIFGAILSLLILNESGSSFGIRGVFALALVCIGIYIVNAKKDIK